MDLRPIDEGQNFIVKWRGKPVRDEEGELPQTRVFARGSECSHIAGEIPKRARDCGGLHRGKGRGCGLHPSPRRVRGLRLGATHRVAL